MARYASSKSARRKSSSINRGKTDVVFSKGHTSAEQRVARLKRLLTDRIDGVRIEVDAPGRPRGDWFIDVAVGEQSFVVAFRPALGFGISSTPSEGIGDGPDEFAEEENAVVDRLVAL